MALNAIDGMLAREFNQQSTLGAILNEVGDIISDAALYLALLFVRRFPVAGYSGGTAFMADRVLWRDCPDADGNKKLPWPAREK